MFLKEIRKYLQKLLNFTIVLKSPDDKKWGTLSSDGKTWNGIVSELLHDKIDISTSGLTVTYDRAEVFDYRYICKECRLGLGRSWGAKFVFHCIFPYGKTCKSKSAQYFHLFFSIPIIKGAKTLLGYQSDGSQVNWFVYVEIFSPAIWAVCLVTLLLMSVALLLASYKEIEDVKNWHHIGHKQLSILNTLTVAFRMLLNLDFELKLGSFTSMIVTFCGSMFGYLMFSFYGSTLTAEMTAQPPILPIR